MDFVVLCPLYYRPCLPTHPFSDCSDLRLVSGLAVASSPWYMLMIWARGILMLVSFPSTLPSTGGAGGGLPQRPLPSWELSKVGSLEPVHPCLKWELFELICSTTHLFTFVAACGITRNFLQHQSSKVLLSCYPGPSKCRRTHLLYPHYPFPLKHPSNINKINVKTTQEEGAKPYMLPLC